MKKVINKIIAMIIIIAVFIQILSIKQVEAVVSEAEITLKVSDIYASLGDTVTVTVVVKGTEISGVQATISYDHDVLEYSSKSMQLANWRCSGYSNTTGVFLTEVSDISSSEDYITGEVELISFNFTVKSDATIGNTTFNLSNMVAVNGSLSVKSVDADVTILSGNSETEISYVEPSTSLESKQANTNKTVELYSKTDTLIEDTSTKLGTGMKLVIKENNQTLISYDIVVIGDLTGDGDITNNDLQMLANYTTGLESLDSLELLASDLNQDEDCATDVDILKLARFLAGYESL